MGLGGDANTDDGLDNLGGVNRDSDLDKIPLQFDSVVEPALISRPRRTHAKTVRYRYYANTNVLCTVTTGDSSSFEQGKSATQ